MNAEDAQPHTDTRLATAEERRVEAEGERAVFERSRQDAEAQRNIMENKRQVTEKAREFGERLRETERLGERLVAEYSTRFLLERIEGIEAQLSQFVAQLNGIDELLKALQDQCQQLTTQQK
jgi:hypothetical protein